MRKSIALLTLAALPLLPLLAFSQQLEKTFSVGGHEMYYLMFTPARYDSSEKEWPLVVFLHGMGERGADYTLLKTHGPPKNVDKPENGDFPFLVLSPQLSLDYRRWQVEDLSKLLSKIEGEYRVDKKRIYLTGLSMGGYGTWDWAFAEPGRFAALAPICGGGDPAQVNKIKEIPVWVFHGERDPVVNIQESKKMVDALGQINGDVRFTIYPTLGHVCWNEAYDSGILYEWFLKQHRK